MSKEEIKTVLPQYLSGGPHGIGSLNFKLDELNAIQNNSTEFNIIKCNTMRLDLIHFKINSPGDPDDKRLRTSEIKVLIPQLIRKRTREVKCIPEVVEFEKCCKETGVLSPFKCRPQTNKLKECMAFWYYNKEFVKECTQIYLNERSEFRRTGITKKQKAQMAEEQQTNAT